VLQTGVVDQDVHGPELAAHIGGQRLAGRRARRLLGDGRFAGVARSQQAEIENMPAPESVVAVLEALVN
jgi:hypothetical protein